ncbi:TPA: hypothetical protein QDZ75_000897 [Stenotrophomonas maltophilia]|nr:hypothetical protein [Stenotrophomonas maltophilia]
MEVTINSCWRAAATIALAAGVICAAQAQQAVQQPYQEYDKKLRSAEQVGALTSDLDTGRSHDGTAFCKF